MLDQDTLDAKVRLAQTILNQNAHMPADQVVRRLDDIWSWCTAEVPPQRQIDEAVADAVSRLVERCNLSVRIA